MKKQKHTWESLHEKNETELKKIKDGLNAALHERQKAKEQLVREILWLQEKVGTV